MSLDGGERVPAVVGPPNDVLMGWSPSGSHLLFASDRSGTTDLWAVPVSSGGSLGMPERSKAGIGNVRSVGITKAGSLYFTTPANEVDIELVSIDSSSGRRISEPVRPPQSVPGTNLEPAWSADGKQLAYVSRWAGEDLAGGTIAIYSVVTRELRELPPLRLAWALGLSWARDGRSLAFVAADLKGRCGIFRIDVHTGAVSAIASPIPLTFQRHIGRPTAHGCISIRSETAFTNGTRRSAVYGGSARGQCPGAIWDPSAYPRMDDGSPPMSVR